MMMSNAQKVTIRIRNAQYERAYGTTEIARTEEEAQGAYYVRNGAYYLLWEERLEGVDEPVQTRLKYRDGCLEVTRRGGVGSHMVFEVGKTYSADYAIPYGLLRMEIAADSVEIEKNADGMRRISVRYRLCQDGEPAAYCELDIGIT